MVPDNYDLFLQHSEEEEEELRRLPICVCCGESIQDEHLYDIDGDIYCESCMKSEFRKSVTDYIKG